MNMMEMGAVPIRKTPVEKPVNPEVFTNAVMESSQNILNTEKESFRKTAPKFKDLTYGEKFETVTKKGAAGIMQLAMNIPSEAATDAADVLYERFKATLSRMRTMFKMPERHGEVAY